MISNRVSKSPGIYVPDLDPSELSPTKQVPQTPGDNNSRRVFKELCFHPVWSRALPRADANPPLGIGSWERQRLCLESTALERRDAPEEEAVVSKLLRDRHRQ